MKNLLCFSALVLCMLKVQIGFTQSDISKAHLNHLALYVMDIKATNNFYQNIIGLDTIAEPFHDGKHTWLRIGDGISMHIIQGSSAVKEYYKNQHICFSVTSLEKFTETLMKYHIAWEDVRGAKNSITTRVDGVKQIWLQDPDGYWIEINNARE